MKNCIVSFFEQGREDYYHMTERLINSIYTNKVNADVIIFSPHIEENSVIPMKDTECTLYLEKGYPKSFIYGECQVHKEQPYLFKSYAIQVARERGYDKVVWADSSIVIMNDMSHYFKLLEEIGVIVMDNPGCPISFYTADDCLDKMGCPRNEMAFEIDAAIMLFDFNSEKANTVFDEYFSFCRDGVCLRGESGSDRIEFKAHRHDQSIMSYIIRKHYINPINYGAWCYANNLDKFKPTFVKAYNGWRP